jgi:thiamine-phosphate pyrophosphorylase
MPTIRRPILCLVTDAGPGRAEAVRDAVASGVDWVQLRDRSLEARDLLEAARMLRAAVYEGAGEREADCALIVNRRLDVALALLAEAAEAAEAPGGTGARNGVRIGVHLGFDAPPLERARHAIEELALRHGPIGVAAHDADEVARAAAAGADYAHLAPIFDPLSKPRERTPLGTEALARASEYSNGCRLFAQGGIEAANAAEALRAGANGVAVTGAILGATHPGRAAARLRATLDEAAG